MTTHNSVQTISKPTETTPSIKQKLRKAKEKEKSNHQSGNRAIHARVIMQEERSLLRSLLDPKLLQILNCPRLDMTQFLVVIHPNLTQSLIHIEPVIQVRLAILRSSSSATFSQSVAISTIVGIALTPRLEGSMRWKNLGGFTSLMDFLPVPILTIQDTPRSGEKTRASASSNFAGLFAPIPPSTNAPVLPLLVIF